jgi:two-component system, OmpR family, alkaline phosphatase synthesis response regulator PhoP
MRTAMKKILVVDDLGIDVMLTRLALEKFGFAHQVVIAGDGEEAWRLLREDRFDLLLLDIKMPRVDGFELLAKLRGEGGAQVPAIIVSGSGLQADRMRADELGAIEYVQKAVDYGSFKETLAAALKRHGFC